MKRKVIIFTIIAVLMLGLSACSSSSTDITKSEVSKKDAVEAKDVYFKDGVLQLKDSKIKITDYKIIDAGKGGNKYGEKPVIAFYFTLTNEGDEMLTGGTYGAWVFSFSAFQDNDPDVENQLDTSIMFGFDDDSYDAKTSEKIKPGGSVSDVIAYELDDLKTPIELKATNDLLGEDLGTQIFEIK